VAKIAADYTAHLAHTLDALNNPGALLVAQAPDGKPNLMTIGWATFGIIWGKPILSILVRHSRHTWTLLEQNGDFTVNVLPAGMKEPAVLCGTKSGRDLDKFAATGLTPVPAQAVAVPLIDECVLHYECRTVHKNNVDPTQLDPGILSGCYPRGDFHTLYYGHILGVQVDADALETVSG